MAGDLMKCKLCGKKGVRLTHWMREHPDYMARRRAAGRSRRTLKPKAPHHRGSRREGTRSFAEHHTREIQAAVERYTDFFCPGCGTPMRHNSCGGR